MPEGPARTPPALRDPPGPTPIRVSRAVGHRDGVEPVTRGYTVIARRRVVEAHQLSPIVDTVHDGIAVAAGLVDGLGRSVVVDESVGGSGRVGVEADHLEHVVDPASCQIDRMQFRANIQGMIGAIDDLPPDDTAIGTGGGATDITLIIDPGAKALTASGMLIVV